MPSFAIPGAQPSARTIAPAAPGPRFLFGHFWLPLLAFALALLVVTALHVDWALAERLYAWQGHRWALRHAFLTQQLVHAGGRELSIALWLLVTLAWGAACMQARQRPWRLPLAYLSLAVLLSTALVAWIKSWSNMDCPWDLLPFGGTRPWVGLFALRPVGLERGACFPAGHASAGYAWMALYFFLRMVRPRLRWWGLAAGALLGLVFGGSQQLRGAHFLSHDLWAALLCWLTALGLYLAFEQAREQRALLAAWSQGPAGEPS